MPNAFYDEALFDKYVAAKITDYTVVRRTVALRSHVSDSMGFTLGVSLDFLPDINKPSAFLLTSKGVLVASSPSIYDGYFAGANTSNAPTWTVGSAQTTNDEGEVTSADVFLAAPTTRLRTYDYRSVRDPLISTVGDTITTQDGVFFPSVLGESDRGGGVPDPEKVVFLSGSVTPPKFVDASSTNNSYSNQDTPDYKALWEASLPRRYFAALQFDVDIERTAVTLARDQNVYPRTNPSNAIWMPAHPAGYAALVSVADDVPSGTYKVIFSNYLEGGAHALGPGHTRFEVNGGGYLPFTLPVDRAPIVPYMRVRPILQPDVMTGAEGYTVQVAMLTKVAQYTKTKVNGVDTLDVDYDRVRSNINVSLSTYSDAWCTELITAEHLPFFLKPMYKSDYSVVQPGFTVPTMRVEAMNQYHAIEFDIRRNVSDIAELQAIYISVELDKGFMPTVFVVEASKDGETWESMATLDIHYYNKAVADVNKSQGWDPTSTDGVTTAEPDYMQQHLVEVTKARKPSPAIIILREGVG